LTAGIAAASAAALLASVAGPAAAEGEFHNGTATAIAQSYKVNPTASGLSIGITFGLSLSDYTNTVSRAESRAIDLGIVGTTLAAEACDGGDPTVSSDKQPQSVFVDSRDQGAAQGRTEQEKYAPFITKSARANDKPESEAVTTSAPIDVPGVLHVDGARSRTLTHVVDGKVREALATSDVANVSLGGGAVELKGLHWESRYLSGSDAKPSASFTIGQFVAGGKPQPIPSDPTALFDGINKVLANAGIVVRQPAFRSDNGIQFVEPMAIAVVPNKNRDDLVNSILNSDGAHQAREQLVDALLEASCKFSTFTTVGDIVIGSLTGAGQFSIELGGVQASSGDLKTTSLLGNFANAADLPTVLPASGELALGTGGGATFSSPGGSLGSTDGTAGNAVKGATGGTDQTGTRLHAAPAAVTSGSRGGKLAAVSAGALALLALLAEADRRTMRRGRRVIPTEV
jgi:hypothetical protein